VWREEREKRGVVGWVGFVAWTTPAPPHPTPNLFPLGDPNSGLLLYIVTTNQVQSLFCVCTPPSPPLPDHGGSRNPAGLSSSSSAYGRPFALLSFSTAQ
jgi:hypothetical protein